ncbi:Putative DNA methylase, N-6 adenine-specific, S-adenosyl-L-methionine-dependent methyltransferase [Septoria linicola]|uniref:DNA methylase, N-6 adenine-specific, S-adenosyl-L-methionine-dependent methyltransferase n=1 Tax=Septoria linicola TaxID=215465 RepID=A0A9Q9EQT5_9PEZI|nr:Putative DNA methylase, N-6 adenine-specific, S-adenosyl-L-methionine-dependent methyltransferase [Septoria linicola]
MLPTPSTSHVNYDHIYEPAEDSYLLLETLSQSSEVAFLKDQFPSVSPPPLVLEVGTGSGVVLAFATANAGHILGRTDTASIGVDVNTFACSATAQTLKGAIKDAESNGPGQFLDSICGDLTTCLRSATIDILIFNPPYVPTEELPEQWNDQADYKSLSSTARFDRDSHLLSLSYAGGANGMETTDRLLVQVPDVLSDRGVAYVLLCKQNRPEEAARKVRAWPGERSWQAEIVSSSGKSAGWEKLCILRIWRP